MQCMQVTLKQFLRLGTISLPNKDPLLSVLDITKLLMILYSGNLYRISFSAFYTVPFFFTSNDFAEVSHFYKLLTCRIAKMKEQKCSAEHCAPFILLGSLLRGKCMEYGFIEILTRKWHSAKVSAFTPFM